MTRDAGDTAVAARGGAPPGGSAGPPVKRSNDVCSPRAEDGAARCGAELAAWYDSARSSARLGGSCATPAPAGGGESKVSVAPHVVRASSCRGRGGGFPQQLGDHCATARHRRPQRAAGGSVRTHAKARWRRGVTQQALTLTQQSSSRLPARNAEFRGSLASSCSTCSCCSGASRRWGVVVSALFSVIFILWRWLFTLLGGG